MNDMGSRVDEEDYIDQLSRAIPWHRSFTSFERILIALIVGTFVSIVGCTLLCLLCSKSPLRRRYLTRRKLDREQRILIPSAPIEDTPPRYDSLVKTDSLTAFNDLRKNRYLDIGRKSSNTTASDSDGVQYNGGNDYLSSFNEKLFRSTLPNGNENAHTINNYLIPPYAQINVELNIDQVKNLLIVHITNGEHISNHPAFDEQAEFFIHLQLLNNKILKKFHDASRKRRSSLQLSTWRKIQEKTTKKLTRTSDSTLICDDYLQFELHNDDITLTSLRFLLFCINRCGIQDLMGEARIRLNPSMISNYQQLIQFKDLPQITFGEINLGISYFPTAERFTMKINKLRYFCRIEKDQKIDARLIVTFLHHGRRFFQKRLPPILLNESISTNNNVYDIKDTIMQNIPLNDIQTVYVHFELIIHILDLKNESILSCGSFLLGEQTRYKTDWQKMLEQPRQNHLGWYQFFG